MLLNFFDTAPPAVPLAAVPDIKTKGGFPLGACYFAPSPIWYTYTFVLGGVATSDFDCVPALGLFGLAKT